MPCSTNYYRYKNNYEKVIGDDKNEPVDQGAVKTIASPRLTSKLSPIS
jgi:hypothetical protein